MHFKVISAHQFKKEASGRSLTLVMIVAFNRNERVAQFICFCFGCLPCSHTLIELMILQVI